MCVGPGKTPGGTQAGTHGTAGLNWDTDQEDNMIPGSEKKRNLFETTQYEGKKKVKHDAQIKWLTLRCVVKSLTMTSSTVVLNDKITDSLFSICKK